MSCRVGNWETWTRSLSEAFSAEDLRERLLRIASTVSDAARGGVALWDLLDVEVVSTRLAGRRGSIIDRWNTRIAVIDDREPRAMWPYIVAHEAAHLLLGAVHRDGNVALANDVEESLCDEFARFATPAGH